MIKYRKTAKTLIMKTSRKKQLDKLIKEIAEDFQSQTDPSGSYTGTPTENGVVPVQDADDL